MTAYNGGRLIRPALWLCGVKEARGGKIVSRYLVPSVACASRCLKQTAVFF